MTRRAAIKQADAKRLIAAAIAAGACVRRITLEDGRLTLDVGEEEPPKMAQRHATIPNPLDDRPVIPL